MSKRIRAGGIELNCRQAGQGEEILFVNGLATDMMIWSSQLSDLSRDHHVILFDNRGTGLSPRIDGRYSMELLADDVANLLASLQIPAATIVGHSMGGLVAQCVALRHPSVVKRLVLASTFHRVPKRAHLSLGIWVEVLERVGLEAFLDLMISQNYSLHYIEQNYRQILFMRRLLLNHFKQVPIDPGILRKQIDAVLEHDTEPELKSIRAPTLVIVGDQDSVVPPFLAEELAEKIPGARFERLPQAAHNLMIERPEEFNKRIRSFIQTNPIA